MFTKDIICLAVSDKHGGKCIAGKDAKTKEWIRPISNRENEEVTAEDICYENGEMPQILDIVRIPLLGKVKSDYQPENILVDSSYYTKSLGKYKIENLKDLCDNPDTIFVNEGTFTDRVSPEKLLSSGIVSSLLFVKIEDLYLERKDWPTPNGYIRKRLKAVFTYSDTRYNISVTDPVMKGKYFKKSPGLYPVKARNIFLCISIGGPWENDGFCYKWVASILTD